MRRGDSNQHPAEPLSVPDLNILARTSRSSRPLKEVLTSRVRLLSILAEYVDRKLLYSVHVDTRNVLLLGRPYDKLKGPPHPFQGWMSCCHTMRVLTPSQRGILTGRACPDAPSTRSVVCSV